MKENKYDDIINLPHHVSDFRAQMSQRDRAAQFSPFAALTGYDAAISETARLTEKRLEADDDRKARIDSCLQVLSEQASRRPEISVTYFKPDERKSGGSYVKVNGNFRKIDEYERLVIFTDGTKIFLDDIYDIEGNIFRFSDMDY